MSWFGYLKNSLTNCGCLNGDGCALVHSIAAVRAAKQQAMDPEIYSFPGGYSPALSETTHQIERRVLWVTDMEFSLSTMRGL